MTPDGLEELEPADTAEECEAASWQGVQAFWDVNPEASSSNDSIDTSIEVWPDTASSESSICQAALATGYGSDAYAVSQ